MPSEYTPVYRISENDASQYGEYPLWLESYRESVACSYDIDRALKESPENVEDCAKNALEKYGFQRVRRVLAVTSEFYGAMDNISEENKQWAESDHVDGDRVHDPQICLAAKGKTLDRFISEVKLAYSKLGMFDGEHCDASAWNQDLEGKVLILKTNTLKEECLSPASQLWLATGGFGCNENARGRAIFATCLSDGENARLNREDFIGVLDEKHLPEWAQEKLSELRQQEQTGPTMEGFA